MRYDVDGMNDHVDANAPSVRQLYAPSTVNVDGGDGYNIGIPDRHALPPGINIDAGYGLPVEPGRYTRPGGGQPVGGIDNAGPGASFDYTLGSLMTPWTSPAPTAHVPGVRSFTFADFVAPELTDTNDPGYKFRLKQGMDTLQNVASAQGIRGGDVAKAFQDYSQEFASSEYEKVFGRAYQTYIDDRDREFQNYLSEVDQAWRGAQFGFDSSMQSWLAEQSSFRQNQADQFNRLFALMGAGTNSLDALSQLGSSFVGNQANFWGQGANARAGAMVNNAGNWGNTIANQAGFWGAIPMASNFLSPAQQNEMDMASDPFSGDWYHH